MLKHPVAVPPNTSRKDTHHMGKPNNSTTMRDVYAEITNRVLEQMERAEKWEKPWTFGAPEGTKFSRPVNVDGKAYHGINVPLLWSAGFASPVFGTFNAWKALGASVTKGSKGTQIIFFKRYDKAVVNEAGEDDTESFMVARAYHVFNLEQVEGAPAKFIAPVAPVAEETRNERAERFFARTGIKMKFGGNKAFYVPSADYVQMPAYRSFVGTKTSGAADSYYGTAAHEIIHATGHASRCAREFGKRFGDQAYAFEELVAELGSAFLSSDLGVSATPRQDHANYLRNWITVLRNDKRAIFTAASQAEKACRWLHDAAGEESAEDADNAAPLPRPVPVDAPLPPVVAPLPQPVPATPIAQCRGKGRKWRTFYGHRPATLSGKLPPWRSDAERAHSYYEWLADRRGWSIEEARTYALAQMRCGLISAHHGGAHPLPLAA